MPELDLITPLPVLIVGAAAEAFGRELDSALVGSGQFPDFSCAGFETSLQAVDASMSASQLILIALGPEPEKILGDPVWAPWSASGLQISRVMVLDGDAGARLDLDPQISQISSDHLALGP